jgi:hypothetical protein
LLLLIPKNLVYILIFLVVASFVIMSWFVYTERNLTQFISSYDRSKEVFVVNPLFTQLQKSMELKKHRADVVQFGNLTIREFNSNYLTKNQPVHVQGMAAQWPATSTWSY